MSAFSAPALKQSVKYKTAASKDRVSQETFDLIVSENVDDFDMSLEEALAHRAQIARLPGARGAPVVPMSAQCGLNVDALAQCHRVWAVDLLGQGKSWPSGSQAKVGWSLQGWVPRSQYETGTIMLQ